jgi:hypothetical protein
MLYLPPVVFGVMAACAGGIAWQRPVAGLGLLVFALAGYIAVAALLAKAEAARRADRIPAVSLVGGGRLGRSDMGCEEFPQAARSVVRRALSR